MSRHIAALFVTVAVLAGTAVQAQIKTIPGAHRSTTASVEAVDVQGRRITLRLASGELRTIAVPQATRLEEIKRGDSVKAIYYDNIVIRKKQTNEANIDTREVAATPGRGQHAGATAATQQTITATIEKIDLNVPSIALTGPRQWRYESTVQDKEALSQLSVGDRVDITWTEATLVSVTPAGH